MRHHHTVADEAAHAFAQYPGRNQVQDRLHAFDHHGMPGIVTALEADHRGDMLGEHVHYLALAFIAPLGPDDHNRFAQVRSPRECV